MKRIRGTYGKKIIPVLLLLVMALVFASSCDPGGDAGRPTGPDSVYNPDADPPRAGMTAWTDPTTITAGDVFAAFAQFLDADLQPVQGQAITFSSDGGYITFTPNPSISDENGRVSVTATSSSITPGGSYVVSAWTNIATPGPSTIGYAVVKVRGGTGVTPISINLISGAPSGTTTNPFNVTYQATGGVAPYTWSVLGTLPAGLALSSTGSLASITGTPTAAGITSVNLIATDSIGQSTVLVVTITIT